MYAFAVGDARHLPLPDECINLVVTSPPYFGLRDYEAGDVEIGGEQTVSTYVSTLCEVISECARVLTPDGSIFLNIGDKYVADSRGSGTDKKRGSNKFAPAGAGGFVGREAAPKGSLIGLPFRVALAALDLGLYWRQEIVWRKPNPLPDPVFDRCSRAHETVIHLTKSRRYFSASVPRGGHGHDVWDINVQGYRDPLGRRHPAVYPEALVERIVNGWAPVDGTVLDPFSGSGTTVAVATRLGRTAIGIDANPSFVALSQTRLERSA